MESVELRLAFEWTCDACGRDQFSRAVIVELDPEEVVSIRERHGMVAGEGFHFITKPETVQCKDCKRIYRTTDFNT